MGWRGSLVESQVSDLCMELVGSLNWRGNFKGMLSMKCVKLKYFSRMGK